MKDQKGFIEVVLIFLAILALWFIWPTKFFSPQTEITAGIITSSGQGCSLPGPNPQIIQVRGKDARLVLRNVFISTSGLKGKKAVGRLNDFLDNTDGGTVLTTDGTAVPIGSETYRVYAPSKHASIAVAKELKDQFGPKIDDYKASKLGLAFLLKVDPSGEPVTVEGPWKGQQSKTALFLLTDVYQFVTGFPPVPQDLIDACVNTTSSGGTVTVAQPTPSIIFPNQNKSADRGKLQLEWFLFAAQTSTSGGGYWSLHCKPAIYLYPEKSQYINVKVQTKGFLTFTEPKYPLLGWTTLANPDGQLFVDNQPYEYLYYESKVPDQLIKKPKTGYVVSYDEISSFYSSLLPKLGLNTQQTKDFKDYWEKALSYSPYYFVGLMDQSHIDELEPLVITPQPDTSIRVRLYFEALNHPITVQPPIIQTPIKTGFTMVEWGGMVKTDKDHPFTCSQ